MKDCRSLVAVVACLIFSLTGAAGAWAYDAATYPHAGAGMIQFSVRPLKGDLSSLGPVILMQASSSDSREFYEIQIIRGDVLVLRDFAPCVRWANRTAYDLKQDGVYTFTLSWNGPSTKFAINGQEIKGHNFLVNSSYGQHPPFLRFSGEDDFQTSEVTVSSGTDIGVAGEDQERAGSLQCPHLGKLLEEGPQEQYKGVLLSGFPGQEGLDKVKGYIDMLPDVVASGIKRIIFVGDGQKMNGVQGLTISQDTFFLKNGYQPSTFFHEAAHTLDFKNNWGLSAAWGERFMREELRQRPAMRSVLGHLDATSPSEQLAQFAGIAYEFYVQNKTLAELSASFGPQTRDQLEFLLDHGFLTRDVFERLTR